MAGHCEKISVWGLTGNNWASRRVDAKHPYFGTRMLRKFLPIFLLLPLALFAMDGEDSANRVDVAEQDQPAPISEDVILPISAKDNSGLTVGETRKFLLDHGKMVAWLLLRNNAGPCCGPACLLPWAITVGVTFVSALVGSELAGIFCSNNTWIRQCQDSCSGSVCPPNCTVACDSNGLCFNTVDGCNSACRQNSTFTPDDPTCRAGLAICSLPILAAGLSLLSHGLVVLRNRYVARYNRKLSDHIEHSFVNGRSDDDLVNTKDMEFLGLKLMSGDSDLLKKLSPLQALALATVDKDRFQYLADNVFLEPIKILAQKLLRL